MPDQGQNTYKSGLCIATNVNGSRCMKKHAHKYVPYCADCMKTGDPSMGVVPHPRFGKMLVAKRELPKGYKMGLWGKVYETAKCPEEDDEWGFETHDGLTVNPCKYTSSQLQYCQCAGPNEKLSVTYTTPYCYIERPEKNKPRTEEFGTMMFVTTAPLPKNNQLNMIYAGGGKEADMFFEERGLTRCDVYTKQYPTFLKAKASVDKLMTIPPKARSLREKELVIEKKNKKDRLYDAKSKYAFDGGKLTSSGKGNGNGNGSSAKKGNNNSSSSSATGSNTRSTHANSGKMAVAKNSSKIMMNKGGVAKSIKGVIKTNGKKMKVIK